MARVQIDKSGVSLWVSAKDTEDWADGYGPKGNGKWPCSQLRGRRLFAAFDPNGLYDLSIDGGRGEQDCDGSEFNAITSDYLSAKLPKDHPCWFVCVGQFS